MRPLAAQLEHLLITCLSSLLWRNRRGQQLHQKAWEVQLHSLAGLCRVTADDANIQGPRPSRHLLRGSNHRSQRSKVRLPLSSKVCCTFLCLVKCNYTIPYYTILCSMHAAQAVVTTQIAFSSTLPLLLYRDVPSEGITNVVLIMGGSVLPSLSLGIQYADMSGSKDLYLKLSTCTG